MGKYTFKMESHHRDDRIFGMRDIQGAQADAIKKSYGQSGAHDWEHREDISGSHPPV